MSEPAWVPLGVAPAGPQTIFPIDFRNPAAAAGAGGCYPNVISHTSWEEWAWQFVDNALGTLYGVVRIPESAQVVTPRLLFECAAAGTGNWRTSHAVKRIANGAALNFASWDTTFAGTYGISTGRTRQTYGHDLTGAAIPAAGEFLVVRFARDGTHADDTLTGVLDLVGGYLSLV